MTDAKEHLATLPSVKVFFDKDSNEYMLIRPNKKTFTILPESLTPQIHYMMNGADE